MKSYIVLITICLAMATSCKSKKEVAATATVPVTTAVTEQPATKGNTFGKVSHQYKATGCATVVVVKIEGEEKPLTLIPKDILPSSIDIDGLEISFNYRTLKMPQPAGCNVGIPAELTEISKK